ncbi:hypothetical protein TRIUR3_24045 [Triticum urartu]|uniref:Uncharacterized protein n=2 Tax=Triticum TaxID=4564 RepID=A0A9R0RZC9_TRITD|nr:hypothetical protein TRIUR3_24045 [Triticum urartu]VAH69638.1 unnamed protein product [Triticum turgidum subsp. durum]
MALLASPHLVFPAQPPVSSSQRSMSLQSSALRGQQQAEADERRQKDPTMKKGQIVRVEKEKYLNSINYLSVGHPPFYKGLDYIYEDRGEAINFADPRLYNISTAGFSLLIAKLSSIAWVGIPTPPAWLPTYMLIKSDKLDYERI